MAGAQTSPLSFDSPINAKSKKGQAHSAGCIYCEIIPTFVQVSNCINDLTTPFPPLTRLHRPGTAPASPSPLDGLVASSLRRTSWSGRSPPRESLADGLQGEQVREHRITWSPSGSIYKTSTEKYLYGKTDPASAEGVEEPGSKQFALLL